MRTTSIVEQLRDAARCDATLPNRVAEEAAAEIERNNAAMAWAEAEIERLRATVVEAARLLTLEQIRQLSDQAVHVLAGLGLFETPQ
jgi:hypothetical protein